MDLNTRSLNALKGVNADLYKIVLGAVPLSTFPFIVTEGLRTIERQKQLLAIGATTTLKSRHLTGHAVDLAPVIEGEVRWDWPLFRIMADAMKKSASEQNIPLEWGGDWKKFKDGPHFQLPWETYP